MPKSQSLSDRARMTPYKLYNDLISEVPEKLLKEKVSLTYFGSSCAGTILEHKRKQMNVKNDESNTVAIENDKYFENYWKLTSDTKVKFMTTSYQDHIDNGNTEEPRWAFRNVPYNDESSSNGTPIWQRLVEADNKNSILDYQVDILPTSLMRGSSTQSIRERYFNDFGLCQIRTIPFDAFKDWGADVETAAYFCQKGYNDIITVKTDIETYSHNFRDEGFIVTPDTKVELDFVLNCVKRENYKFTAPKLIGADGKKISYNIKNSDLFSKEKSSTFKYPILCEMKKDKNVLGYTSIIVDQDYNKDRLVIPNYTGGWDGGKRELGVVKHIEPGIQLPANSYKYIVCTPEQAEHHARYLTSTYVQYLQYVWKVQRTNDAPQLRSIPLLEDFTLENDDDILEYLNGVDIKQEILDGFARKTR